MTRQLGKFSEVRESGKSLKPELGSQLQYALCYLCLIDSVVTPSSLVQELAGSNNPFDYKYFFTEFSEI